MFQSFKQFKHRINLLSVYFSCNIILQLFCFWQNIIKLNVKHTLSFKIEDIKIKACKSHIFFSNSDLKLPKKN